MEDPFAPKPNAHRDAIIKLLQRHPELAKSGNTGNNRRLYTYYLDICPAFISEETFERKLAEVKAELDS